MQIGLNTTRMLAGITVVPDEQGRDHCVVVVKGTFAIGADGGTELSDEQEPLVHADVHWGEPGVSNIRYECDFAPHKPKVDILVNGSAFAPSGRAVTSLSVVLEVAGTRKEVLVTGERRWVWDGIAMGISEPEPFLEMPITFDRAFGGVDASDAGEVAAETRNLAGRGFWKHSPRERMDGMPLPNVEYPEQRLSRLGQTPAPAGFGVIGRACRPRIDYAGTYDQHWMDEKYPLLPDDFDPLYFQAAPAEQQLPELMGGERIRCTNLTPDGFVQTTVPRTEVPIEFLFENRKERVRGRLDTLVLEPDHGRMMLTWRASVSLGRKINALREVNIGKTRAPFSEAQRITAQTPVEALSPGVKPHFESLGAYVEWRRMRRSR